MEGPDNPVICFIRPLQPNNFLALIPILTAGFPVIAKFLIARIRQSLVRLNDRIWQRAEFGFATLWR